MNTSTASLPISSSPVPYAFQDHNVRTILHMGKPWFLARDVCAALGITWSGATLNTIPVAWRTMLKLNIHEKFRSVKVISEPAVYKLAFRSNKPEADKFTNWVASEVLPSIRKTGTYSVQAQADPEPSELTRLTTGAERKHLATTRAKIMGALGPSTPGYQRFSRTINKALGINHIRELTIDRLPSVEALFDMMWLFVQAGRPEEQPKRAAFILERLEPCGDTHKDAIEEIVESLRRGWETYTRFVSNAEADMHKVVRAIIADMENCDMTAMEKYHLRAMADEIARAINEQGHLQHIAGNAMRPIMRTMIHMGNALAIKRKRSIAALPAGRGRSRKQAALPR